MHGKYVQLAIINNRLLAKMSQDTVTGQQQREQQQQQQLQNGSSILQPFAKQYAIH